MNFHLIPNWTEAVVETYEFRTTVFTSRSGKEQRVAERKLPRRTVGFTTSLWGDGLRAFQALLHERGAQTITIPDPARYAAVLAQDATVGSLFIVIQGAPPWLAPNMPLSLSDINRTEFRGGSIIANVGAFSVDFDSDDFDVNKRTRITLTSPLARTWPKGTSVRPVIEGRLPPEVDLDYRNDSVAESEIKINVLPPSQVPDFGGVEPTTFNGRQVLLTAPNWTQRPSVTNATPYEVVDYGRGVTEAYLPVAFYTRTTQFNYLGRTRDKLADLISLFVAMRGRQGEFYCPSWVSDMEPASGMPSEATTLAIHGTLVHATYADSTVNRAVGIRLSDGRWIFRTISSMSVTTEAGGGEFNDDYNDDFDIGADAGMFTLLHFDEAIGEDIYLRQITMVCWVNVCRFASDTLTISWSNDDVGQVTTQVMTLESLTPET